MMIKVQKLSTTKLDDYVRAIIRDNETAKEMRKTLIEATKKMKTLSNTFKNTLDLTARLIFRLMRT